MQSYYVKKISVDCFTGNNALMRELYETETPPMMSEDLQHVETAAAMWCHRTRVTIEHLTHELNEHSQDSSQGAAQGSHNKRHQGAAQGSHNKQHQILQMFLHEVHFTTLFVVQFSPLAG